MNKYTANYYDGKTAKPQEIEVFFDEYQKYIQFTAPDATSINLNLKDIKLEYLAQRMQVKIPNHVAYIKIEDPVLMKLLQKSYNKHVKLNWYQAFLDLSMIQKLLVFALSFSSFIAIAYFTVPAISQFMVRFMPHEFDAELGDYAQQSEIDFLPVDTEKTKIAGEFLKQLNISSHQKIKIDIINEDVYNAFALPNGKIVIYSTMLNRLKSADELVALIGHEAAHVQCRHAVKSISHVIGINAILLGATPDITGAASLLQFGKHMQGLSYSRDFESEADAQAVETLIKNKINPKAMLDLLTAIKEEGNKDKLSDSEAFTYLSSHPSDKQRIEDIKEIMAQKKPQNYAQNKILNDLFVKLKK